MEGRRRAPLLLHCCLGAMRLKQGGSISTRHLLSGSTHRVRPMERKPTGAHGAMACRARPRTGQVWPAIQGLKAYIAAK